MSARERETAPAAVPPLYTVTMVEDEFRGYAVSVAIWEEIDFLALSPTDARAFASKILLVAQEAELANANWPASPAGEPQS